MAAVRASYLEHTQAEEIIGAQIFNFAPKFSQNSVFGSKLMAFWTKIFRRENLSTI